ncbi:MAG: hypothetical protein LBI48_01695 [Burkholderiaceae bacterium]|jgi:hypothetical protein|nr:hypothetical protein [Burkholderiaceae bacterium]
MLADTAWVLRLRRFVAASRTSNLTQQHTTEHRPMPHAARRTPHAARRTPHAARRTPHLDWCAAKKFPLSSVFLRKPARPSVQRAFGCGRSCHAQTCAAASLNPRRSLALAASFSYSNLPKPLKGAHAMGNINSSRDLETKVNTRVNTRQSDSSQQKKQSESKSDKVRQQVAQRVSNVQNKK